MKINSITIDGYKSLENFTINLGDEPTILIGINNSGKSSILKSIYELLCLTQCDEDVLSSRFNIQYKPDQLRISCELSLSGIELIYYELLEDPRDRSAAKENLDKLFHSQFPLIMEFNGYKYSDTKIHLQLLQIKLKDKEPLMQNLPNGSEKLARYWFIPNEGIVRGDDLAAGSTSIPHDRMDLLERELFGHIIRALKGHIRCADAIKQIPQPTSAPSTTDELEANASNLTALLLKMKINNDQGWEELIKSVKVGFDKAVVLRLRTEGENTTATIYDTNGSEYPLAHCGTGLTQFISLALNILNKEPLLILLDEPHAFLHPSAEKALYRLILNNPQHRYIIATHSPIAINIFRRSLTLVQKNAGLTILKAILPGEINEVMSSIGISAADLFIKSFIIFVEGDSDPGILTIIMKKCGIDLSEINACLFHLKEVTNTQRSKRYMELIQGISDFPIKSLIILDGDNKTSDIEEYKRIANDTKIFFTALDQPEIEDYLLYAKPIFEVLTDEATKRGVLPKITQEQVDKLIQERGADEKGSHTLKRIFNEGLGPGEYNKVKHGWRIAEKIPQEYFNNPEPDFITWIKERVTS